MLFFSINFVCSYLRPNCYFFVISEGSKDAKSLGPKAKPADKKLLSDVGVGNSAAKGKSGPKTNKAAKSPKLAKPAKKRETNPFKVIASSFKGAVRPFAQFFGF